MQESTGGSDLVFPFHSKGKEERRSLVERTVTIVRDESSGRGYGLTVSGDNPVFVQFRKENGRANLAIGSFCLGGSSGPSIRRSNSS